MVQFASAKGDKLALLFCPIFVTSFRIFLLPHSRDRGKSDSKNVGYTTFKLNLVPSLAF